MLTVHKKEDYRVSKWLSVSALLDPNELRSFAQEMGSFSLYRTGELVKTTDPVPLDTWVSEYKEYLLCDKKISPLLMTFDQNDVYGLETAQKEYLIYPKYPVIQIREHKFAVTMDGRIQTMVFGKDSVRWGLIFSYPQIFYDPRTKTIVEVFKDKEAPNTEGFRKIQKWMRDWTKPVPFVIQGKRVNATFRVGKNFSKEFNPKECEWKEQEVFMKN